MEPGLARGETSVEDLRLAFRKLKSHGCVVLVCGDLPGPVQRVVSRRVMGDPSLRRVRFLALLTAPGTVDEWFPGAVSAADADVRVLDFSDRTRGVAARPDRRSTGTDREPPGRRPAHGAVVEELAASVSELTRERELAPEQLRVVVVPVDTRPTGRGSRAVLDLLSLLDSLDGMSYVFVPGRSVSDLAPEFRERADACIDVRADCVDDPEHRWIISGDVTGDVVETEWIPVEPGA